MSADKANPLKSQPPIVVLDTNTVLSSLLFSQNKLSQLRVLWQSEKIIPLASKATISELIRVLVSNTTIGGAGFTGVTLSTLIYRAPN